MWANRPFVMVGRAGVGPRFAGRPPWALGGRWPGTSSPPRERGCRVIMTNIAFTFPRPIGSPSPLPRRAVRARRTVLNAPALTREEVGAVVRAVRLAECARLGLTDRTFDPEAPLPGAAAVLARRAEMQLPRRPLSRVNRAALVLSAVSVTVVLAHQTSRDPVLLRARAKIAGQLRVTRDALTR